MLCCAVLCCAVLCCAVLCCAVLCCAVLCCAVPCCAVLCRAVLCCAVPCCAAPCHVLVLLKSIQVQQQQCTCYERRLSCCSCKMLCDDVNHMHKCDPAGAQPGILWSLSCHGCWRQLDPLFWISPSCAKSSTSGRRIDTSQQQQPCSQELVLPCCDMKEEGCRALVGFAYPSGQQGRQVNSPIGVFQQSQ